MILTNMTRTTNKTYIPSSLPLSLRIHLPLSLYPPLSCSHRSCFCCCHHCPPCVLFPHQASSCIAGGGWDHCCSPDWRRQRCQFFKCQHPLLPCTPLPSSTWWLLSFFAGNSSSHSNQPHCNQTGSCTWKLWECPCIPTWGASPALLPK